jgi:hypothetical protein
MKTTTQISAAAKDIDSMVKAGAARIARKPKAAKPAAADGYGETATRFVKRAKGAFGAAYAWAGEAGGGLPATARRWGLGDTAAMQNRMADNPLVLGVMGLGIGAALGMMLAPSGSARPPAPRKSRRR